MGNALPPNNDHARRLLHRLDEIGAALDRTGQALALLGLGSVGLETDRLDAYSDLDFYVIVEPGTRAHYLDSLDWLATVHPLVFSFQNSAEGYKALFADGIFCELGIFEPDELAHVAFAPGRVVWERRGGPDWDRSVLTPHIAGWTPPALENTTCWLVGETLANLYVGLGRYRRGEILTATRFIQEYAILHIVAMAGAGFLGPEQPGVHTDSFGGERRFEQRYPDLAERLPQFMQGYAHNIESAQAILAFLEAHFEVNPAMRTAILKLCQG